MKPLSGAWSGIVGGTNIGHVRASLQQTGGSVTGQFDFQDMLATPLKATINGSVKGRLLDGTLSNFLWAGTPPVGMPMPTSGRVLAVIEEDGDKITGFWMSNVLTTGGFILLREN